MPRAGASAWLEFPSEPRVPEMDRAWCAASYPDAPFILGQTYRSRSIGRCWVSQGFCEIWRIPRPLVLTDCFVHVVRVEPSRGYGDAHTSVFSSEFSRSWNEMEPF